MRRKTESYFKPEKWKIAISGSGKTAQLSFAENIEEVTRPIRTNLRKKRRNQEAEETETEIIFIYDSYTFIVPNRDGLFEDVSNKPDKWLEKAKQDEYNKLAAEVRVKRDKLLADTDKDFVLDRINLNIPEKVTSSTMLNVFKDILNVLGSVCNSELAKYRQALRDIPQQEGFPYDVKYPIKPKRKC